MRRFEKRFERRFRYLRKNGYVYFSKMKNIQKRNKKLKPFVWILEDKKIYLE